MSRYDGETALIVVDMQNDFADPAGSLYVPRGEEVVAVVNQERSTWSRTMASCRADS